MLRRKGNKKYAKLYSCVPVSVTRNTYVLRTKMGTLYVLNNLYYNYGISLHSPQTYTNMHPVTINYNSV